MLSICPISEALAERHGYPRIRYVCIRVLSCACGGLLLAECRLRQYRRRRHHRENCRCAENSECGHRCFLHVSMNNENSLLLQNQHAHHFVRSLGMRGLSQSALLNAQEGLATCRSRLASRCWMLEALDALLMISSEQPLWRLHPHGEVKSPLSFLISATAAA